MTPKLTVTYLRLLPGDSSFQCRYDDSPKDGQPLDLLLTANQIPVYDAVGNPEDPNATRPSLTIEWVELEYFVNNHFYQVSDPNY